MNRVARLQETPGRPCEVPRFWSAPGAVEALAEVVETDVVDRSRSLTLTGMTLGSAAHVWPFDPARVAASLNGKPVGHELVDDLGCVAPPTYERQKLCPA